jgi:hypothetical protein
LARNPFLRQSISTKQSMSEVALRLKEAAEATLAVNRRFEAALKLVCEGS